MVRLGIVGFDTSHCVEFTKRLNHKMIEEDLWVDGARVVLGWAGSSAMLDQEAIQDYQKTLTDELGVELVENPQDMVGQVDGVLIESLDGSVHYERALPFVEAGVPCYVDKPFTCSLSQARELARLATEKNVPLFSASSLRYAVEIQELHASREQTGEVVGAEAYSPCSLHPRNPGLFNYGIHAVETLFALMGPGCRSVRTIWQEGAEVTVGVWEDGRIGSMRGLRDGTVGYGFTAFCEKQIVSRTINARYIYRELLKQIVRMFQTGTPPLDIAETIEIIAFIEAAYQIQDQRGVEKPLSVE